MGRALVGCLAVFGGGVLGLIAVAVLAVALGFWNPFAGVGAAGSPTAPSRPAAATPATPASTPTPGPAPRQPAVSPGAGQPPTPTTSSARTGQPVTVNSLAELAAQQAALRGKLVRVLIGEPELTGIVGGYLTKHSPVPVSDVQVKLHPGQVVLTGTMRQSVLSLPFTVAGHPVVSGGKLSVVVDSVEPAALSQLGAVSPGQTVDVPAAGFDAQSAQATEGQLVVTGVVR